MDRPAKQPIRVRINGDPYYLAVDPWRTLNELLRDELGLIGTKLGCGSGDCGACTVLVDGRAVPTDQSVEVRAPMVISSIGSVPERLPGIAMRGELYDFIDWDLGRLEAYPNLFSAGNVVTGQGNIVASRKHARYVASEVVEGYVRLADQVKRLPPISSEQRDEILNRVRKLQSRVGYDSDYPGWIRKVTPPDLV